VNHPDEENIVKKSILSLHNPLKAWMNLLKKDASPLILAK